MQNLIVDERYEVAELLGRGGMGEVRLALDKVLNRQVALKMLHRQYADDEEFVERFKREAQSAAALTHPNIVSTYDRGRSEDGTYYIAMEYLSGGTLKDRILEDGPLGARESAEVAIQISGALEAAHERGVIHRDIKPQNILFTGTGFVKVVDFGIARAAAASTRTQTSVVLGTASYMSPEQALGEPVGPRSDLYALGVVLYEMLTGTLPYEAETPIGVALKHVNEPPRPPKEINPGVSEGFNAVVLKLLAKNPEDRYASAGELAEDLRRVRDGLTPLAVARQPRVVPDEETRVIPVPPAASPGRRLAGRDRQRLPLLAALLAALTLLGGFAVWGTLSGGFGGDDPVAALEAAAPVSPTEKVPDVTDMSEADAEEALTAAGLRVGDVTEESSETVPEGRVIEQDVTAGEEAEPGTEVNLTISSGPEDVQPSSEGSATPATAPAPQTPASAQPASASQAAPTTDSTTAPAPQPEAPSLQPGTSTPQPETPAPAAVPEAAPMQPVAPTPGETPAVEETSAPEAAPAPATPAQPVYEDRKDRGEGGGDDPGRRGSGGGDDEDSGGED